MGIIYFKNIFLKIHNYPYNNAFSDYNLNLHEMIDMHSKYDKMHKHRMFNALISINNHIIACLDCMLSWAYVEDQLVRIS